HAVVPVQLRAAAQPQVDLVDEGGGLQGVAVALAAQVPPGDLPQLAVDQRQQFLGRRLVALLPSPQELRDLLRRRPPHASHFQPTAETPSAPGPRTFQKYTPKVTR